VKRTSGLRRVPLRTTYRSTGPSEATVELVAARDGGRCAACGALVTGRRGIDWSVQHRLPRQAGGTRRPWVNLPGNLVLLHGHGTSLCNGDVESDRARWTAAGFLVRNGVTRPADTPIEHAVHGRVLLADDGGVAPAPDSLPERAS
jgi:5-methylcytosine-specific restriction protein A